MPGLLQSSEGGLASLKFVAAFFAELIGVLLFTLYGSAVASPYGPWANGITLAVLVYATANVSGGHLNPAVTIATMVSGHHGIVAGIFYIIAQLCGACLGILLLIGLVPGLSVGMGDGGPGCFAASDGVTRGMAFGWELTMTFLLVAVVYAVAIGKPNFVETGPMAVGFTLWASAFVGGQYTGASLNPARTLGPAFVYHCNWRYTWVYILAEILGGIVAGLVSWPLYGTAGPWARGVLRPFTNKFGPVWKKLERSVQAKIDKLPPGVSSFLDMKTTTDGEGGDENLGDEEQGGDSGKSKKKSGSDKKPDKDSERGMLKSPGNRKQMRSRAHTPSDGHQQNSYTPQQYQQNSYTPQQYQPRQDGFADESPVDGHQPYTMGAGDLTRFPSINMDWQTLRTPPR